MDPVYKISTVLVMMKQIFIIMHSTFSNNHSSNCLKVLISHFNNIKYKCVLIHQCIDILIFHGHNNRITNEAIVNSSLRILITELMKKKKIKILSKCERIN